MDKLAFGGGTGGDDQKTTEQRIQDEIAGDDVLVRLISLTSTAEVHNPRRVHRRASFHGGSGMLVEMLMRLVQTGTDFRVG